MELWIATMGAYQDEWIAGIGRTEAEARGLIDKVREAGEAKYHSPAYDHVYPMPVGQAFNSLGDKA